MKADGGELQQIAQLVDAGVIRPVVGATIPFEQTALALTSLGKSSVPGKTVITLT